MVSTCIEQHGWPYVNLNEGRSVGLPSQPVQSHPPMIHPQLELLARRIRALVAASGFSQVEVARSIGVDKSTVSKWIKGERTPTMQNLVDLAELLGVEMKELWDGPEAIPSTPEQRLMIERMRNMTPEQQQAFLALAAATLGPGEREK